MTLGVKDDLIRGIALIASRILLSLMICSSFYSELVSTPSHSLSVCFESQFVSAGSDDSRHQCWYSLYSKLASLKHIVAPLQSGLAVLLTADLVFRVRILFFHNVKSSFQVIVGA